MKKLFNYAKMVIVIVLSITCINSGCRKKIETKGKPNVIVIFSDDMGYADGIGATKIPIPNMDRLANSGVRFTNAYSTAPVCVASRMGLLSGCYQQRFGVYGNFHTEEENIYALQHTLLPKVFQDNGYRTALVGKWHLSGNDRKKFHFGPPLERGFDEFVGILAGCESFWAGTTVYRGNEAMKAPKYLTDFWGDEACLFIEKNKEEPFFLYLAFNAVHAPMHSLEEDKVKLKDGEWESPMREIYSGMMSAMDRNIGKVIDKVEELGIDDNTIIAFLNDNGAGGSTNYYADHSRNYGDNSPYRGYKFDLYEGGIRTPFFLKWPGRIKAGSEYNEMVSSMDLYPTLVEAAGLELPDQEIDGVNLLSYIEKQSNKKDIPHPWICWENRNWSSIGSSVDCLPRPRIHNAAIRQGKWKMVRYFVDIDVDNEQSSWELYNLSNDAGESNDLAKEYPEIIEELSDNYRAWKASMRPSMEKKK